MKTAACETKSDPVILSANDEKLAKETTELNLLLSRATCACRHYLNHARTSRIQDKRAYGAYVTQADLLAGKIQEVVASGLTVTLRGGNYADSPLRIRRTSGECFNISILEASADRSGTGYDRSDRVAMLAATAITVEDESQGGTEEW